MGVRDQEERDVLLGVQWDVRDLRRVMRYPTLVGCKLVGTARKGTYQSR